MIWELISLGIIKPCKSSREASQIDDLALCNLFVCWFDPRNFMKFAVIPAVFHGMHFVVAEFKEL